NEQTLSLQIARAELRAFAGDRFHVQRPFAGRCARRHRFARHRVRGDRPLSLRRLHHEQPASFAFNDANKKRVEHEMTKYPQARQASAVISALWIGQEQHGWVTKPMIELVAKILDMPYIRVLEVATFYTMFNLSP